MAAALCIPPALVSAQASQHAIPAGTRIDFVSDETINVDTVRPGGSFRIHLAQPLVLDGTQLAAAGMPSRVVIADKHRTANGTPALVLTLANLHLKQGELPVVAVPDEVPALAYGTTITAVTAGSIDHMGDRIVVRVPVPVPLSSSLPNAAYTALPAATAGPIVPRPRRGAKPTPLPTTFNPDTASSPEASAAPDTISTLPPGIPPPAPGGSASP